MAPPNSSFTKALPKIELHAHLTGSISISTLHDIWISRQNESDNLSPNLADPVTTIPQGQGSINVATFFPLFDKYIYSLVDNLVSIRYATREVLFDFMNDGVVYIELRTTPRAIPSRGISKEEYVQAVLETMTAFMKETNRRMVAYLILSIDRRNTLEQATEVVDLATKYHNNDQPGSSRVVGLDLCGNPQATPITHLTPAFHRAKSPPKGFPPLPLTLHFAETPTSSSLPELETLLSWSPQRLGHICHPPPEITATITSLKLGLELCLSCNVLAGLSEGGFKDHHFGYWNSTACPIALGTDDVGIFGSRLSEEYLLAAEHFGLSEKQVVGLSRGAVEIIFGGELEKIRLRGLLNQFERDIQVKNGQAGV